MVTDSIADIIEQGTEIQLGQMIAQAGDQKLMLRLAKEIKSLRKQHRTLLKDQETLLRDRDEWEARSKGSLDTLRMTIERHGISRDEINSYRNAAIDSHREEIRCR